MADYIVDASVVTEYLITAVSELAAESAAEAIGAVVKPPGIIP
jgi:hypothetical protein